MRVGENELTMTRRGVTPPPAPGRSASTGSPHIDQMLLGLHHSISEQNALLRAIAIGIGTLDLIVYEHDTQELPTTQDFFTMALQPQTSQVELITGIFASIVMPTTGANTVITLTNAWAKLGRDYVNMNTILNSFGAMGGMVPGIFTFVVESGASRTATIVANQNWPQGAYFTFALFGKAVPATEGGVLH